MICDNLSAHKAPVVHRWLLEHPRFELHFHPPTHSSWINQVVRHESRLRRAGITKEVRHMSKV
ncbi:hypothetical protein ACH492_36730 [Streptomyces sp. NPDC019443]|uniref:hypothetical protein n=1 Tax=Streptomyces sp. NPDC019443 TaxID=3365061 RepID=UPI00379B7595